MARNDQLLIKAIRIRRGTLNEWLNVDPILDDGEIGYIKDLNIIRIGNGVDKFSNLNNLNANESNLLLEHINDTLNPHNVTKLQIGLPNVDNTSDVNKPISTATQEALNLKVDKVFGKGLSEADFTTAEKTKLSNISENANNYSHPNHTGDVTSNGDGDTTIGNNVVDNAKLSDVPTNTFKGRISSGDGDPEDLTISQVKSTLSIDNIDNTSDLDKPISNDTQDALDLKTDTTDFDNHANDTTNPHSVTKAQVGLSNVDNTSDINKPISTATQDALDNKVDKVVGKQLSTEDYTTDEKNKLAGIENGAQVNTVDSVNGQTDVVVLDKTSIGLSNVDNTSDLNKPVSTATQSALDLKVDKVAGKQLSTEDYTTNEKNKLSGIETGAQVNTVTSVAGRTGAVSLTKSDVGLNNVDNVQQAPLTHVGATGNAHGNATTSIAGFMSSDDKAKLDGIESGAEANTVDSVAGKTGVVTLNKGDVGLDSAITNETDVFTPDKVEHIVTLTQAEYDGISPAADTVYIITDAPIIPVEIQAELDTKADIINSSFTGIQVLTQAEYDVLTPNPTVIYFIKDV